MPGTRATRIAYSRSASGKPTQWYRHRRLMASWISRVRLDVTTTMGGVVAFTVPVSGIVIW